MAEQKQKNRICQVCKGNGFIKIPDPEDYKEINIHQCWECNSEGEIDELSIKSDDVLNDDHYWNYHNNELH